MLFIGQKDTHQPITNAVTGSSITQTIFNRMTRLATLSMVFTVMQQNFLILAESGHSDRNGGILLKNRKNSAKIGMVGSYVSTEHSFDIITDKLYSSMAYFQRCNISTETVDCADPYICKTSQCSHIGGLYLRMLYFRC